jgi:hypothetical protein
MSWRSWGGGRKSRLEGEKGMIIREFEMAEQWLGSGFKAKKRC